MSIPLAGQLWKARSEGTLINLATVEVPVDEDAAYKIQDAISHETQFRTRAYSV